ncbi:MAG: hypothetical protein WCK75_08905 [Elusimicrobiota bacterium]
MENTNITTFELRFTKGKALLILTAFFLCWHPRFLGSETLTLTTYYPAPYGGYNNLLTTGQTLLARDGGVAGSYVNIGAGYNGTGSRRDANVKLEVGDGGISTSNGVQWGLNRSALTTEQGGSIELGGAGGTPRVDFSQNMTQDYSARLWLSQPGRLEVVGDFAVTGIIQNVCSRVPYITGPVSFCPTDTDGVARKIVGSYGDGVARVTGYLPTTQTFGTTNSVAITQGQDWNGIMICCRF